MSLSSTVNIDIMNSQELISFAKNRWGELPETIKESILQLEAVTKK